ncbi:hypothetical protein HYFRA_00004055 [Hymenoscyphus fraxineus]|uniref:Protein kinase domain-containing protein n=1 Tax=Hymenoscyphus fraxineus TaxID=746836 RepID=A0A9N9KMF4_9HELO|nr:hypothetical protein HYFRA_00004055 [Hymenoscyphus fraxineus]
MANTGNDSGKRGRDDEESDKPSKKRKTLPTKRPSRPVRKALPSSKQTGQPVQPGPPYPVTPGTTVPGMGSGTPQVRLPGALQRPPRFSQEQGLRRRRIRNTQPFNSLRDIYESMPQSIRVERRNITQGSGSGSGQPRPAQQLPAYPNNPQPRYTVPGTQRGPPRRTESGRIQQVTRPGGNTAMASSGPRSPEMLAWPESRRGVPELADPWTPPDAKGLEMGYARIQPLDGQGKAHYRGIGSRLTSIPRNLFGKMADDIGRLRNPNASASQSSWDDIDPRTGFNRREWLRSEREWTEGIAGPNDRPDLTWQQRRWKGTKFLGQGSNGIIGLWERKPGGEENPPESQMESDIDKVVVKQQKVDDSFRKEAAMFDLLKKTNSSHLVQAYKTAIGDEQGYDVASAERNTWMPPSVNRGFKQKVGRMFMELCDGGTLDDYLAKEVYIAHSADKPFPERLVWNIFGCVALGLIAIEHGSENPSKFGRSWQTTHNLVHFDIKGDNVFVKLGTPGHEETPLFKIADFGCMQDAPQRNEQFRDSSWARRTSWLTRFTGVHAGPEMTHNQYVPERYYGSPLNVWQIGRAMATIVLRGRDIWKGVGQRRYFALQPDSSKEKILRTMGTDILDAPYSVALRSLLLRCLAYDWKERPTPTSLWQEVKMNSEVAEAAARQVAQQTRLEDDQAMFEELQRLNMEIGQEGEGQPQSPRETEYQTLLRQSKAPPRVTTPASGHPEQTKPPEETLPLFTDPSAMPTGFEDYGRPPRPQPSKRRRRADRGD